MKHKAPEQILFLILGSLVVIAILALIFWATGLLGPEKTSSNEKFENNNIIETGVQCNVVDSSTDNYKGWCAGKSDICYNYSDWNDDPEFKLSNCPVDGDNPICRLDGESCMPVTESQCWNNTNETDCNKSTDCTWNKAIECRNKNVADLACWNYYTEGDCQAPCEWKNNTCLNPTNCWNYNTEDSCPAHCVWNANSFNCNDPCSSVRYINSDDYKTRCLAVQRNIAASEEESISNPLAEEQTSEEQTSEEQTSEEQTSEEQTSEEQTSEEQTSDNAARQAEARRAAEEEARRAAEEEARRAAEEEARRAAEEEARRAAEEEARRAAEEEARRAAEEEARRAAEEEARRAAEEEARRAAEAARQAEEEARRAAEEAARRGDEAARRAAEEATRRAAEEARRAEEAARRAGNRRGMAGSPRYSNETPPPSSRSYMNPTQQAYRNSVFGSGIPGWNINRYPYNECGANGRGPECQPGWVTETSARSRYNIDAIGNILVKSNDGVMNIMYPHIINDKRQ